MVLPEYGGRVENAGKESSSSGAGDERKLKPNSTATATAAAVVGMVRPARLPEECNASGHRELQVCDKTDGPTDDWQRGSEVGRLSLLRVRQETSVVLMH